MPEENFTSRTDHILYIVTNTRYGSSFNDAEEFGKSLDIFKKLPSLSPLGLYGEYYQEDYVCGMYPEFEPALKEFFNKVYPDPDNKKALPDNILKGYAHQTMLKFGLNSSYDFSKEPDAEQLERLNERIMPKQIKDMDNFAPEVLREMGIALLKTSKDFRVVHYFMKCFSAIQRIASGEIEKEEAKNYTDIKGVIEGLSMLELVEQGIIDKDLHIVDMEGLCKSKQIQNFEINGKKYNLAETIRTSQNKEFSNSHNHFTRYMTRSGQR